MSLEKCNLAIIPVILLYNQIIKFQWKRIKICSVLWLKIGFAISLLFITVKSIRFRFNSNWNFKLKYYRLFDKNFIDLPSL